MIYSQKSYGVRIASTSRIHLTTMITTTAIADSKSYSQTIVVHADVMMNITTIFQTMIGFAEMQRGERMSEQRLIDANKIRYERMLYARGNGMYENVTVAYKDEIDDMPTIEPQQWIPCSERLPEEGERVLATHLGGVNPNRQVIEHIYQCGEFTCGWDMDMNVGSSTFGQRYMGKVIAWMPLPKPYRGEQIDSNT